MSGKFLPKDEVKRRAQAGLEKMRREKNPMLIDMSGIAPMSSTGPQLDKDQRRKFVGLCDVAIAMLADRQFEDWFEACRALKALMQETGFQRDSIIFTFKQIEMSAEELAQEEGLGDVARTWVAHQANKVSVGGRA